MADNILLVVQEAPVTVTLPIALLRAIPVITITHATLVFNQMRFSIIKIINYNHSKPKQNEKANQKIKYQQKNNF